MAVQLAILPVLLALGGALAVPIAAVAGPRAAWPIAVVTGLASALAAAGGLAAVAAAGPLRYAVGGWEPPWGIEVVLDGPGAFTATTVAAVGSVALAASGPDVRASLGPAAPAFYALALLVLTGLLGITVSGDLFNVFVFLEVAALGSYALVASGGGRGLAAAFRYLVLGTVGASFYLLGVGLLYGLTGTLNMGDLAARLPGVAGSPAFAAGTAFIVAGLAVKMGLFPLHGWLPDAYTHAPAPAAAFIAPIGTKAAAYVMARLLLSVLPVAGLPAATLLAWAGAAAIVAGGLLALRQADARRLLAYSSVSQMGYIALGVGLANASALSGAYLHLLTHATMKGALFLVVGAAARRSRGPAVATLGLGRGMPVTAACAVVAGLSMVGVPPTGGFFSKWYLLQGAVEAGEPVFVIAILLGSLLAAVYVYRLTESAWFERAPRAAETVEAPWPVLVSLVVLAAGSVAVGPASAAIVSHLLAPAAAGAR
jgi:multicomponent Na+:H+ antiporter subunit D